MRVGGLGRGRCCRLYTSNSSRAAKSEIISIAEEDGSSRMGSQIDFRWWNVCPPRELAGPGSVFQFLFSHSLVLPERTVLVLQLGANENRAMGEDVDGEALLFCSSHVGVVDKRACIQRRQNNKCQEEIDDPLVAISARTSAEIPYPEFAPFQQVS